MTRASAPAAEPRRDASSDDGSAAAASARPVPPEFAALLSPMEPDEFFARFYERDYVHIPGPADKFAHLLSLPEFRRLVADGVPWRSRRAPETYYEGCQVRAEDLYFAFESMDGQLRRRPFPRRMEKLLAGGASLVSYGMHEFVPALARLTRTVARTLGGETEAHVIYSRQGKKGLSPHYDSTDVFVFHLAGQKEWNVWDQRVAHPIGGKGAVVEFDEASTAEKVLLSPGSLLYLPRGRFHDALAVAGESLHVAAATKVPTGYDFLTFLLRAAIECDDVRAYFAAFDRSAPPGPREDAVRRLMGSLTELALDPAVLDAFEESVRLQAHDEEISFPFPVLEGEGQK